jgi:hypothetical protein
VHGKVRADEDRGPVAQYDHAHRAVFLSYEGITYVKCNVPCRFRLSRIGMRMIMTADDRFIVGLSLA